MKKLILLTISALSLTASAGGYDKLELVFTKGETAMEAYSKAQDIVAEVNGDTWGQTRFSYLSQCNPGHNDNGRFLRKAFTSSSKVRFNHVTGVYTGQVDVRCED